MENFKVGKIFDVATTDSETAFSDAGLEVCNCGNETGVVKGRGISDGAKTAFTNQNEIPHYAEGNPVSVLEACSTNENDDTGTVLARGEMEISSSSVAIKSHFTNISSTLPWSDQDGDSDCCDTSQYRSTTDSERMDPVRTNQTDSNISSVDQHTLKSLYYVHDEGYEQDGFSRELDTHSSVRSKRIRRTHTHTEKNDQIVDNILKFLLNAKSIPSKDLVLDVADVEVLMEEARCVLLSQPALLQVDAPVNICGDIHGQFYELLQLFEVGGPPPLISYLFLGDYVDRGLHSVEVVCLLLAFKVKYPDNFFIVRGNHESADINRVFGFYDECKRRYNHRLWEMMNECFNCLPFAAIVEDRIFCCHGGLSPELHSMEQIQRIARPTNIPEQGLLADLVWADPSTRHNGWERNHSRGVSFTFGMDVLNKFLHRHQFQLLCRAHEVPPEGFRFHGKKKMVTLISAPNYGGVHGNDGAFMNVDKQLVCSFKILKPVARKSVYKFSSRKLSVETDFLTFSTESTHTLGLSSDNNHVNQETVGLAAGTAESFDDRVNADGTYDNRDGNTDDQCDNKEDDGYVIEKLGHFIEEEEVNISDYYRSFKTKSDLGYDEYDDDQINTKVFGHDTEGDCEYKEQARHESTCDDLRSELPCTKKKEDRQILYKSWWEGRSFWDLFLPTRSKNQVHGVNISTTTDSSSSYDISLLDSCGDTESKSGFRRHLLRHLEYNDINFGQAENRVGQGQYPRRQRGCALTDLSGDFVRPFVSENNEQAQAPARCNLGFKKKEWVQACEEMARALSLARAKLTKDVLEDKERKEPWSEHLSFRNKGLARSCSLPERRVQQMGMAYAEEEEIVTQQLSKDGEVEGHHVCAIRAGHNKDSRHCDHSGTRGHYYAGTSLTPREDEHARRSSHSDSQFSLDSFLSAYHTRFNGGLILNANGSMDFSDGNKGLNIFSEDMNGSKGFKGHRHSAPTVVLFQCSGEEVVLGVEESQETVPIESSGEIAALQNIFV